jgi:heme/copper-type cytochrome/quinol oxidase subunit 2
MAPAAVLWICALVVAGVFAVMIHSIATFRSPTARLPLAEVFWAIVPIVIMVSTALPAVRMLASERATHDTSIAQTTDYWCCGSGFSRTAFNPDRK